MRQNHDISHTRVKAAKRKLSVVKRVSVLFPSPQSPATGDREGGGEGGEGTSIELTRDAMEAACEPLLQRLKAPLYEVALAAAVSLPGEARMPPPSRLARGWPEPSVWVARPRQPSRRRRRRRQQRSGRRRRGARRRRALAERAGPSGAAGGVREPGPRRVGVNSVSSHLQL